MSILTSFIKTKKMKEIKEIIKNPLIEKIKSSTEFDGALPFDRVQPEEYIPAMEWAITDCYKKVERIKKQEHPTFENIIVALEQADYVANMIATMYFHVYATSVSDALEAINAQMTTLCTDLSSTLLFDEELFSKVQFVYDHEYPSLVGEDKKLLEEMYQGYVRKGATLSQEKKDLLRDIHTQEALLRTQFKKNVLDATNAFLIVVDNISVLSDMPKNVVEVAAEEAEKKGESGKFVFTLQAPSYGPFMQYCTDRSLREKLCCAQARKATSGEYDNKEIIQKIVALRYQQAQLLGFPTYADYVLSERMAKNLATVQEFEEKLTETYVTNAHADTKMLQDLAKEMDNVDQLQQWDVAYYEEKLQQKLYNFSSEVLRPYFSLNCVIQGAFTIAHKMYGIQFLERTDIPVYHQDVKVYEVQETDGTYVGLLYTDFFPRESKRAGAWMNDLRPQGNYMEENQRPHVTIVCNFTKPTETTPSLLTHDEVTTLFHEFGHALHGLLSRCTYASLSGTNVRWDFVELPSQLMENWGIEKESLDLFASHYQTGETIPKEYLEKIHETQNFMVASSGLGQVKYGLLDLVFHGSTNGIVDDIYELEANILGPLSVLPPIPGRAISCSFNHIFSGGYAAGYYSYKWAEVLAADAFAYFNEKGIFNPEVTTAFRKNVLERGGTEDPMELYKKFRGQAPDPKALHRREGLL